MQGKIVFKHIVMLLFVCLPVTGWSAARPEESIRILIGNYPKDFSVSGSSIRLISINDDKKSSYAFKQNILIVQKKDRSIKINRDSFQGQQFILSSADGELSVNGVTYGGTILISCAGDQGMMVINEIALERYLEGLISLELSPRWELTAMKVQAVVARTYALYQKSVNEANPYHLTSSARHQIYRGIAHANGNTRRAVRETRGEVLTWNGAPIMAVYHSCCGGRTESAENVWGTDKPYLKSVFCGACTNYEKYFWKLIIPRGTFIKQLCRAGYGDYGEFEYFIHTKRSPANRVIAMTVKGDNAAAVIPCNELRSVFGFLDLRSTNFIVKETDDGYLHFMGIGNGHGVGLCQWGARTRAQQGETYQEILNYYYPGTQIKRVY